MRNYDFRKVTMADIPMLRRWLQVAHVRAWFPDAEKHIAQITQDMDKINIDMRIVEVGRIAFAYVSDFDVHAAGKIEFGDLPQGTRGLATFVGNPDFMGPGHAAGYIAARVRELRRRHALVAVGPNTTDTRAIGIFRQAGFHPRRLASTNDGKLVQVMTHL